MQTVRTSIAALASRGCSRELWLICSHTPRQTCRRRVAPGIRLMASEKEAAQRAADSGAEAAADGGQPTLFDRIVNKTIPADVIYETDSVLAFRDINPQAPVHFLVIPKHRNGLTGLSKADERHTEVLGQLLLAAGKVAAQEGLGSGYRVVINDGRDGCQSVFHLHLHVMGGRQLNWPPG